MKNLVLKIYKIMNIDFKKLVKITPERRGKDYAYLLNTSKIRKTLKWKDKIRHKVTSQNQNPLLIFSKSSWTSLQK